VCCPYPCVCLFFLFFFHALTASVSCISPLHTTLTAQAALRKLIPLADRVLVKRVEVAAKVRLTVKRKAIYPEVCRPFLPPPPFLWARPRHSTRASPHHPPCCFSVPTPLQSAGGILLPDTGKKLNEGEVVSVGPGALSKDGKLMPMNCAVGDRVLLPEYGGHAVKVGEDELQLFRDEDILGKFK
jgi:chaperonin GroES